MGWFGTAGFLGVYSLLQRPLERLRTIYIAGSWGVLAYFAFGIGR